MSSELATWSNNKIVFELKEKTGLSFRQFSISQGYSPTALSQALYKKWPRAEQIIASAIGVEPCCIWPNRYHDNVAKTNLNSGAKS